MHEVLDMATMIRSTAYFTATLDRINVKRAQRLAASYGQVFHIKEDCERKCDFVDLFDDNKVPPYP